MCTLYTVYSVHYNTVIYCKCKCILVLQSTVLIEITVFPSLHLNKNASLIMIRNDVFKGTVSASMLLSTQIRFVFVII